MSVARPPHAGSSSAGTAKVKLVTEALVEAGLLKHAQVDAVASQAQRSGERLEEVLLDHGLVAEADLLKALAARYKAFFISSEKLAKLDVPRAVLDMVPARFAEKFGVCPVVFDAKAHALSVVTADPDDVDVLREVKMASGAREVKAILARPAAVKAIVGKTYGRDPHAFAVLSRQAQSHFQMLNVYEPERATDGASASSVAAAIPARPSEGRTRAAAPVVLEPPSIPPAPPPTPPPPPAAARVAAPAPVAPPPRPALGAPFVEMLNVMVSLLENARPDLRGHSSQVARLVRRMAEKIGLDAASTEACVAAAYVHDLGKMGQYHLTALNSSEYEGHKVAAQKVHGVPARLLEAVHLPSETVQALVHMYERHDGRGFPDGLAGKDIPLGARLLAICDTYADLTQNPRNPFRKALSAQEASAAIGSHKGAIFDPNLVDLFHHTVAGEDLKARLLADRQQALIVDVDPEETTVLELRLVEQGFVVKIARSVEQALEVLGAGDTDLVVGEVDLGAGDGLALLAQARAEPWGKDVPWVVYTQRQERALAQRAFDLGVLDYVSKPANADVLVAKVKALLTQRAGARGPRGVSGSLREMGLPDMVQVLFHGRKTGSLGIQAPEGAGQIHFQDGNVVDARWNGLRGEDAFFAMLRLQDGDFALDPSFKPGARAIHTSSEGLLLEGMRRMDEGI